MNQVESGASAILSGLVQSYRMKELIRSETLTLNTGKLGRVRARGSKSRSLCESGG